jgi:hypothetical protein
MKPFLDNFGVAHCIMPTGSGAGQGIWRLDDAAVSDLLTYRYFTEHKEAPSPRDVGAALAIIKGELWHTRREPIIEESCPVLRTMCKAAESMESWIGSAGDLRKLLQTLAHDFGLLKRGEQLPQSDDAMGVWLSKNAMRLRARGIELSRPKATARKRLWTWQRLSRADDTSDTLGEQESGAVSSGNNKQANEIRQSGACDTLTDEQTELLAISKGAPV